MKITSLGTLYETLNELTWPATYYLSCPRSMFVMPTDADSFFAWIEGSGPKGYAIRHANTLRLVWIMAEKTCKIEDVRMSGVIDYIMKDGGHGHPPYKLYEYIPKKNDKDPGSEVGSIVRRCTE